MIGIIISTLVQILVGYLFIVYIPRWLNARGVIATILKVIGVLIILSALFDWI